MREFSQINANAYDSLFEVRDLLFRNFEKNQDNACEQICSILEEHIDSNNIETILDVGCGTGEILMHLEQRYGSSISYIGCDVSSKQIQSAKSKAKKEASKCKYICCAIESLDECAEIIKINWSKTILLCTGHTLPHFEQQVYLSFLEKYFPKYLFVDFYHTFDEVISTLEYDEEESIVEPRRIVKDNSYALVTKTDPKEKSRILRGIEKYHSKDVPEPIGITTQSRQKSSYHVEKIEKLGYLRERLDEYNSGYGPMKGYLFIIPDKIAKKINDVYFSQVSPFVQKICRKGYIQGAMELVDIRVAAAVLPFDAHFTFAKYISIVKEANGKEPKTTMLVDEAKNVQTGYPTAHGLYMSLLDQVSSPNIIPITELKGSNLKDEDIRFLKKEEGPFFKLSKTSNDNSDNHKTISFQLSNKDAIKDSFFVIPFYIADLPVFTLIVSFSKRLSPRVTNQGLYFTILENIANLIERELDITVFTKEVLRDFVDESVSLLAVELKKPREHTAQEFKRLLLDATNKEWKSWYLTLPNLPIKCLSVIEEQHKQLVKSWRQCLQYALADIMIRISDWFSMGSFFKEEINPDTGEKNGHGNFCCDIHKKRLKEMLKIIEVQSLEEISQTAYFRSSRNSVELTWTIDQLKILENCNVDNTKDYDEANCSFWRLKSLFCKEEGGKGSRIRFGISRIEALCRIYHPKTKITYGESFIFEDLVNDGLFPLSNNDYTDRFIHLIKSFNEDSLQEIRIGFECEEYREYYIRIKLKEEFTPGTRGHDFGSTKNALKKLGEYDDDSFHMITIKFWIEKNNDKKYYWILKNGMPCTVQYE